MTRAKSKFTYVAVIIAVILSFFSLMAGGGAQFASAAASSYSNVLDDLETDKSFKAEKYPENEKDYSLKVIQVAESTAGDLFIYVYNPSARTRPFTATQINMSLSEDITTTNPDDEGDDPDNTGDDNGYHGDNGDSGGTQGSTGGGGGGGGSHGCSLRIAESTDFYDLILLSKSGVFAKYRVKNFTVSSDPVRYYNITSILRPFDKIADDPPADGQTINATACPVGQLWTARTVDGKITYEMTTREVIEITEKYVGYCNYTNGIQTNWLAASLSQKAVSLHFVAFSTNKPMDKLISASVTFCTREVSYKTCIWAAHNEITTGHSFKDEYDRVKGTKTQHKPVTRGYKDKVAAETKGNRYTWDRIRTTAEFLSDNDNKEYKLTAADSASIENTQWVLNFYETQINYKTGAASWVGLPLGLIASAFTDGIDAETKMTEVSEVSILSLEFETDGKTYSLGAVDNKQTGSGRPSNEKAQSGCAASFEWLKLLPWWAWVLIFFAVIVAVVLVALLIVWLVKLPFKLMNKATSAPKHRSRNKPNTGKKRKRKGGKK